MEFSRLKIDGIFYGYYARGLLSNGQVISIFFIQNYTSQGIEFSVLLVIANKKRHIREWLLGIKDVLSDRSTGKCGLEGLLWGKKKLKMFEEYLKDNRGRYGKGRKISIVIYPTDSRRRRVYAFGLKNMGYKIVNRPDGQCLYKQVV